MKLWSYKKPTQTGWYYCNNGDVVTWLSLDVIKLTDRDGALVDEVGHPVEEYHQCFKFKPIDYQALNKIGNES